MKLLIFLIVYNLIHVVFSQNTTVALNETTLASDQTTVASNTTIELNFTTLLDTTDASTTIIPDYAFYEEYKEYVYQYQYVDPNENFESDNNAFDNTDYLIVYIYEKFLNKNNKLTPDDIALKSKDPTVNF